MSPSLSDVMTPFPYTIDASQSAQTAHTLLTRHHVRHLAVLYDTELVGVLSDRDVNLALQLNGDTPEVPVFVICSKPAYVVDVNEPLPAVVRTMAEHRLGCALVTKRGELEGIVTTTDLCRVLSNVLDS